MIDFYSVHVELFSSSWTVYVTYQTSRYLAQSQCTPESVTLQLIINLTNLPGRRSPHSEFLARISVKTTEHKSINCHILLLQDECDSKRLST